MLFRSIDLSYNSFSKFPTQPLNSSTLKGFGIRNQRDAQGNRTLRALEEGLEDFAGCAVVISHDRWFLDRICTHILAFEGDSNVFFFEGSYSEYEENKLKRLGKEEPTRVRYRKLMND